MQLILDSDEAWSIMSLIVSQVLDQTELTEEGAAEVRRWRGDRVEGTGEMADLTVSMNEALGTSRIDSIERRLKQFATDEAWELMSHVIGRMLDEAELSDADRAKVRRWKSDEMRATSQEMRVLTTKINEDLEKMLARKQKSAIRKPDWR